MTGLPTTSRQRGTGISPRHAGIVLMVLGVAVLLGLIGCGTPQQRYHTLSTFFDGVPNPDAAAHAQIDEAGVVHVSARVVSQHKPYVDNKCAQCHNSASGEIQEFELAYNACVKCHAKVSTERPLMHGPVARQQCKWCHTAHESTEPALLKDTPITVCTQCHTKDLLSSMPPQHSDGTTSCLQCHFGHGGPERYFLKPVALPTGDPDRNPATAPAPSPSTQPATRPAAGAATRPVAPAGEPS